MASSTTALNATVAGHPKENSSSFEDPVLLRTTFALAMSTMYKAEVPLYGHLVRIVQNVNQSKVPSMEEAQRLTLERHGAIRLGTSLELQTVRRIFALIGMYPVGYYDLAVAGLPMHATCFRPIERESLQRNPFRVFTTLLRPELLQSDAAKDIALKLLKSRSIFSDRLMELLDLGERQGNRLTEDQAEAFIPAALRTFSWQGIAAASLPQYQLLKSEHPILADIACFRSAHINHLTPRTLDIDEAQAAMVQEGMAVKSRIEGPPARICPILLRQTSFLALEEKILFPLTDMHTSHNVDSGKDAASELSQGSHQARFGEIEERGAAATVKGRHLYDMLLDKAMQMANSIAADPPTTDKIMREAFEEYPDSWTELRRQGLVYFEYRLTGKRIDTFDINKEDPGTAVLEKLIAGGLIEAIPITYEDFLPFSAAGIFQSNLQTPSSSVRETSAGRSTSDLQGFESALGDHVFNLDELYIQRQNESLTACARALGLNEQDLVEEYREGWF
ncbi:uncharacterized protein ATNIH1004_009548 [Aspergillus tanneri]|uniref:2-oxoadipate dioxygenase/decarboxylase n=1 Tax=Aspergillus tanneri TaxID=1220188 RepID=A0A5M9MAV3_9EURO|nr:uncharacterized protein ATNIH1004_009548 [Aspergillus tanneri]KAA8642796.1 hypothetical protein ATNIH1004_009548 [Aspergillus tanneri]